jgi:hypothetical protein
VTAELDVEKIDVPAFVGGAECLNEALAFCVKAPGAKRSARSPKNCSNSEKTLEAKNLAM